MDSPLGAAALEFVDCFYSDQGHFLDGQCGLCLAVGSGDCGSS